MLNICSIVTQLIELEGFKLEFFDLQHSIAVYLSDDFNLTVSYLPVTVKEKMEDYSEYEIVSFKVTRI